MLTQIRVQNLKSFADSGYLDLPPLTFLMGPNSAGKTTLLQAVLLARQTVDSRDLENSLVVDGSYVQLGSYPEFVHKHDADRELQFEFGFAGSFVGELLWQDASQIEVRVQAQFSYEKKQQRILRRSVKYAAAELKLDLVQVGRESEMWLNRDVARIGGLSTAAKFYDLTPQLLLRHDLGAVPNSMDASVWSLASGFTGAFEAQFKQTYFLGPLRSRPERMYGASGETPQDVGLAGESTLSALWQGRTGTTTRRHLLTTIGKWLKRFGIASKVNIKQFGGSYFQLFLTDPNTGTLVNFADVGFGASQLLPSLVEPLYAPLGSTILFAQPEIHLHPGAQATLGDFFAEQATRGQQLIVETHSEHLVERVLRRVAEGGFSPDDLAIYYCEPSSEGTQVKRIAIDEYGRFGEGLPRGFFEHGYQESMATVEAIAKRVRRSG